MIHYHEEVLTEGSKTFVAETIGAMCAIADSVLDSPHDQDGLRPVGRAVMGRLEQEIGKKATKASAAGLLRDACRLILAELEAA